MTLSSLLQRKTSEVVIVDFDEATVRCLLQYMYGCLPEMPRRHHEVRPFFLVHLTLGGRYNIN